MKGILEHGLPAQQNSREHSVMWRFFITVNSIPYQPTHHPNSPHLPRASSPSEGWLLCGAERVCGPNHFLVAQIEALFPDGRLGAESLLCRARCRALVPIEVSRRSMACRNYIYIYVTKYVRNVPETLRTSVDIINLHANRFSRIYHGASRMQLRPSVLPNTFGPHGCSSYLVFHMFQPPKDPPRVFLSRPPLRPVAGGPDSREDRRSEAHALEISQLRWPGGTLGGHRGRPRLTLSTHSAPNRRTEGGRTSIVHSFFCWCLAGEGKFWFGMVARKF